MLSITLIAIIVTAIVGYYLLNKRRYKLPSGPKGWPYIGNVFQLDRTGGHKTITEWHKRYGDVFMIKMFGNNFVILGSYDTIFEGLVTKANHFAGRPSSFRFDLIRDFCPDITFSTFSKKWVFMKKLTMSTLKMYGNNLETLEKISLDLIDDMVTTLNEASEAEIAFDPQPIVHTCISGIIASITFGKKPLESNVKKMLKNLNKGTAYVASDSTAVLLDLWPWTRYFPMRGTYKQILQISDDIRQWFTAEINEARARFDSDNPNSLLDGLFEYQKTSEKKKMEFTLTDDDLYGISLNMIFAGTATTSISTYSLISLWINKPELQEKMAGEILSKIGQRTPRLKDRETLTFVEAAILELLRFTSIIPLNVPHCTTIDTSIGGYDIPKGTRIFFNLWKLHHDPLLWEEPWEFKPERFLDEQNRVVPPDHPNRKRVFAFGASRRVCVGETLAKNRLFLIVVSLLQRYKFHAESEGCMPECDPRRFKSGFGIKPPEYKCRITPREITHN